MTVPTATDKPVITPATVLNLAADLLDQPNRHLLRNKRQDEFGNRDLIGYVILAWRQLIDQHIATRSPFERHGDPAIYPATLKALRNALELKRSRYLERQLVEWNDEHGTKQAAIAAYRAAAMGCRP